MLIFFFQAEKRKILEQFHIVSALATSFDVFAERLGHSDFVHKCLDAYRLKHFLR